MVCQFSFLYGCIPGSGDFDEEVKIKLADSDRESEVWEEKYCHGLLRYFELPRSGLGRRQEAGRGGGRANL